VGPTHTYETVNRRLDKCRSELQALTADPDAMRERAARAPTPADGVDPNRPPNIGVVWDDSGSAV
jgi:hypothetical protein